MSDQPQVMAKEFARNPNPEIRISCSVCEREYPLSETLKEAPMPPPHETVIEGFLVCPQCGDRKHSYYMSEILRWKQSELKKALERFNLTRNPTDWRIYTVKQKRFQAVFDTAQEKYTALFKKETA